MNTCVCLCVCVCVCVSLYGSKVTKQNTACQLNVVVSVEKLLIIPFDNIKNRGEISVGFAN